MKKASASRKRDPPSSESQDESSSQQEVSPPHSSNKKIVIKEDRNQFHTFGERVNEIREEESDDEYSSPEGSKGHSHSQAEEDSYDSDVLESKSNDKANRQIEDNDSDQSMDYIEMRIKKLERELEEKLVKHKGKQENTRPLNPTNIVVDLPQPADWPLKPKEKIHKEKPQQIVSSNASKKKLVMESHKIEEPAKAPIPPPKRQPAPKPAQAKAKSKSPPRDFKQEDFKNEVEQLRKENAVLKQKLRKQDLKRSGLSKEREEIIELEKIISSAETTKLEKELQLLKILEAIKVKLKKSINRKLAKLNSESKITKGNIASYLMHKGCSSNVLS